VKPTSAPADALAIVVGVERSRVYDSDPLVGPVNNAIAAADWCLGRRVPPDRVKLFVSPKASSEAKLAAWQGGHAGVAIADAREQTIQDFLVHALPALGRDGLLLLFWSGHGVIDQRGAQARRMFYEDSSPELARNLDLMELLQALRGKPYARFPRQVLILDTCANYSFGLRGGAGLLAPTPLGRPPAAGNVQQWTGLAAAPGQLAANEASTGADAARARFTTRLLDELGAGKREGKDGAAAEPWPDFAAAFERTRTSFDDDQTPVNWVHGAGDVGLNDNGVQPLSTSEATTLLPAVTRLDPDDAEIAACAAAALGDAAGTARATAALRDGLVATLELLAGSARPAFGPAPLHRFAEQLLRRAGAARETKPLADWLRRHADPVARDEYRRALDAEVARPADEICFVLVDERSDDLDGFVEFDAFLFVGDESAPVRLQHAAGPVPAADATRRADVLGEIFACAYEEAAARGVTAPRFIVEVALPVERVDEDLAALSFVDGRGKLQPVAGRHAVVRRLSDRLRALSRAGTPAGRRSLGDLAAWRDLSRHLCERLRAAGVQVVWRAAGDPLDGSVVAKLRQAGSCLGFDAADAGLGEAVKEGFYVQGLPFACWTRSAWTTAEKRRFQRDLAAAARTPAPHRIFELGRDAGHPAARVAVLWDDPARDPYIDKLG